MAGKYPVTGDQYRQIDRVMIEIKRQLNQRSGCPLDPQGVLEDLRRIADSTLTRIDCDALPSIPNGLYIESHRKDGRIKFDPDKMTLHLDEGQKNGRTIVGNKLRRRLAKKPVMNACVLDHLLANTHLIPDSWMKFRHIYFWGTIYRADDGLLYVRYLCWSGDEWDYSYSQLDYGWDDQDPAAIYEV